MSTPEDDRPKVITIEENTPSRWSDYYRFAHEFDGYEAFPETLPEVARSVVKDWYENGTLPDDLVLLRSSLFFQARSSRFITGYPGEEDMAFLDALVKKIKELLEQESRQN